METVSNLKLEVPPQRRRMIKLFLGASLALIHTVGIGAFQQPWGIRHPHKLQDKSLPLRSQISDYHESSALIAPTSDEVETVTRYTSEALRWRGKAKGLRALESLGKMSSARKPFDFSTKRVEMEGSVLSKVPGLIPREVTDDVFEAVKGMQEKGWLSTNPDSVDGLPSFHLNLVSNGEPVIDMRADAELDEFQSALRDLTKSVEPYVYNRLLPRVHDLMNSTSIKVSDIFLRRYGDHVIDGESRRGISAHYDVFSKVTSVIALDDVAMDGTNGLFTTATASQIEDENSPGRTSNHAALRRYFPLSCGDAMVHTWGVLHGVDVEPGLDRTSLIVWFTTDETPASDGFNAPWLLNRRDLNANHISQFVLASALESSLSCKSLVGSTIKESMHLHASTNLADQQVAFNGDSTRLQIQKLYLESASRENTFALTRIGNICENDELDARLISRAAAILGSLNDKTNRPPAVTADDGMSAIGLAKRFWWEGATRGNPNAQMVLADTIMAEASESGDEDARLVAAVLFGLAAQQGNDEAVNCLNRVVEFDVVNRDVQSEEELHSLPVVQTASSATRSQ